MSKERELTESELDAVNGGLVVRELTTTELDVVSGGGTNGGTVAAGWDTAMSSGPIGGDATIMTTEGLMGLYGRGNAGAIK